jgi:hypothetical protein
MLFSSRCRHFSAYTHDSGLTRSVGCLHSDTLIYNALLTVCRTMTRRLQSYSPVTLALRFSFPIVWIQIISNCWDYWTGTKSIFPKFINIDLHQFITSLLCLCNWLWMPNIQSIHGHRGSDEAHKKALDKRWHVPLHVGFVETVSSLLILIFSSCEHAWEKNTCTRMVNAMINTFNSPLRPRQNVVSSDRQVNAMLLCSLMLQSTTDS